MVSVTLKPIVVPRGWDGQRLLFALVFNFEINPVDDAPPLGGLFEQWPTHLDGLLPAVGNGLMRLVITPDGGSAQEVAISRTGTFDSRAALSAWSAIFYESGHKQRAPKRRSTSPLADIFTKHPAPPAGHRSGGGIARGRDVSVNPRGASDLRPTQRIESLEMTNARSFLSAAESHAQALRSAQPHVLAKAKAVAFKNAVPLSKLVRLQSAGRMTPAALALAFVDLEGVDYSLVAAVHLAQQASSDGGRLKRSIDLARNRPTTPIDSDQLMQPSAGEILARLKHHPGAMRILGLVVDCSAPFNPSGVPSLVAGKVGVKTAGLFPDIMTYAVSTRFDLRRDPHEVSYFRAQQRDPGSIDDENAVWRRFHLLPPSFFSLQQSDHARAVMRAQQGVAPSVERPNAGVDDALTDAIIIQAEHGEDSVAHVIQTRLKQAQLMLMGTEGKPAPTPDTETLLCAEDLMSGVTFEAALGDTDKITGAWHSLCRRRLTVTSRGTTLFECDEDGYVSTSVATSAAPLVGSILSVTAQPKPDASDFDNYELKISEDAAYNTPSAQPMSPAGYIITARRQTPRSNAQLAAAKVQKQPAAQATQLRGIFRDTITLDDLVVNPKEVIGATPTTENHDRVQLTIGPSVVSTEPTLIESLFISPLFDTGAFKDPDLPQTGLQVFRAQNKLRGEGFHFALDGAVTAFLNSDGTEFSPPQRTGAPLLPDAFSTFEAEGERRAYLRTASDIALQQSFSAGSDIGQVAAVISDSLPQAALTPDHVMPAGNTTLLPLPFAPPGKSDRFTELKFPQALYPLQFRFRGKVTSAKLIPGAASVNLRLAGVNEALTAPALVCPLAAISDRAEHSATLNSDQAGWVPMIISGDGILERPGGQFVVLQLRVLGKAGEAVGDATIAEKDAFFAWVPRVMRLEEALTQVRGPVTGRLGFEGADKIRADKSDQKGESRFVLASAPDNRDVQNAFVTVSWPGIAAKNPSRLPKKIVLPTVLTTVVPVDDLIVSALGRVEDVAFLDKSDNRQPTETVLLIEFWNVLASGSIQDQDLSDEARAAKTSPHLDWLVTVSTDDQGDVLVRFDATYTPKEATAQFHPLDLRLRAGPADPQPLWVESVCSKQAGQLRGVGWPGWVAAYAAPSAAPGAERSLTLLDLRTLRIVPPVSEDGKALSGCFKLAGPRGHVRWEGSSPIDTAFVRRSPLLRILGEVVSLESDADDCVLHLAGLTGATPWQLQVRCAPTDRFGDITSELVSRRPVDLLPGDCVFASVRPDPRGWYQIALSSDNPDAAPAPGDAENPVALAAGLFGAWRPPATSSQALTKVVLTHGTIDYLPGTVTTPRGVTRQVWAPRPSPTTPADRSAPANLLLKGEPIAAAMIRYLPVAFVRTLIAHAKPEMFAFQAGGPNESFPAVHAVASDALARWRGWWLTVPQPGTADAKSEDPIDSWPVRLKSSPLGLMLPLRKGQTYWIRGWRTDLAGNSGFESLTAAAQQALAQLQASNSFACARRLENFKRPDFPLAPVLAQPGKTFGRPDFSDVSYGLVADPDKPAAQQPGTSSQSLSLVLVTNRKGDAVDLSLSTATAGAKPPLFFAAAHLLPPPVDVETVIGSGRLDPDPHKTKGPAALKAHAEKVRQAIYQHEQFYDDHLFGRRPDSGLNYFPDPFATIAVMRLAEALPSALLRPEGSPGDQPSLGPWSAFERLSFFPHGEWPKGVVASQLMLAAGSLGIDVEAQSAVFRVPPAAAGQAQIVAVEPDAKTDILGPDSGLTLNLIHAVTGPLRQPQWITLAGDPPRKASDTGQVFAGQLAVDVPSTGSMGFSVYWSDLWDENVPALFGAAQVRARVSKGVITAVVVDDPGFGYGSEAVVKAIGAGPGHDAALIPIVSDGRLAAVTVERGGIGYPDGDISVAIGRRPPLFSPAAAVATIVDQKIVGVSLAHGAEDNGYYVRPPLVRIHDRRGTGSGAEIDALVVDGRVTEFKVNKAGQDYSQDLIVGVYTNEAVIEERAIADRKSLADAKWSPFAFRVPYAFRDTRARHLYLVGQGHTRFRDEVAAHEQPLTTEPRRFELVSSARPPRPEIAYLLPSFEPIKRLGGASGNLIEQHDAMIRCYVRRPWNATGDERLGVVVFAAQINTTRVKEDPRYEGSIPASLRNYVSRWGFDPVWDDFATAPLTLDDFTNAVDVARYDDLAEFGSSDQQPVGIALHDMHYSPSRDMWFADVAIRPPQQGQPFVQLALVRYQSSSVPGLSMSDVSLADPIVLPAWRRVTIRATSSAAEIEITGNFDAARASGPPQPPPSAARAQKKATLLPKRKLAVELRMRSSDLPPEIEGPFAYDDSSGAPNALDHWELQRTSPTMFSGKVEFDVNVMKSMKDYYLALKELEVTPTAASFRDHTGSTGTTIGQPAFERLVFYRALDLEGILQASCR